MAAYKDNFFSPKTFLAKFGLVNSPQYKKYQFLNRWEKIVGSAIFRHSKIISFKHDILYLQVNDPMWKNELTLNKQGLIKKINRLFPKTGLKDIVFSYHPFKNNLTQKEKFTLENKEKSAYFLSDQDEKKKLKIQLSHLPPSFSKELKVSLAKLKFTWSKIKTVPPNDIFPRDSHLIDYSKSPSTNLNFVNHYFPLISIRSEFLNFDVEE